MIKGTSQFNEDFMKNYNEVTEKGYLLEVNVQYTEKLHELHNDIPFLPERTKLKRSKSLLLIYMIRLNMSII